MSVKACYCISFAINLIDSVCNLYLFATDKINQLYLFGWVTTFFKLSEPKSNLVFILHLKTEKYQFGIVYVAIGDLSRNLLKHQILDENGFENITTFVDFKVSTPCWAAAFSPAQVVSLLIIKCAKWKILARRAKKNQILTTHQHYPNTLAHSLVSKVHSSTIYYRVVISLHITLIMLFFHTHIW